MDGRRRARIAGRMHPYSTLPRDPKPTIDDQVGAGRGLLFGAKWREMARITKKFGADDRLALLLIHNYRKSVAYD